MPTVQLSNVSVVYGSVVAVDEVDLRIEDGEAVEKILDPGEIRFARRGGDDGPFVVAPSERHGALRPDDPHGHGVLLVELEHCPRDEQQMPGRQAREQSVRDDEDRPLRAATGN